MLRIDRLDHLVLTVSDIETTAAFYSRVLGMKHVRVDGRHALHFGREKINLHEKGREFEPKAAHPTPGSGDICLVTLDSIEHVGQQLADQTIPIEQGPVERTGALGAMRSIYIRDPDRNLVEVSSYVQSDSRHQDQGSSR